MNPPHARDIRAIKAIMNTAVITVIKAVIFRLKTSGYHGHHGPIKQSLRPWPTDLTVTKSSRTWWTSQPRSYHGHRIVYNHQELHIHLENFGDNMITDISFLTDLRADTDLGSGFDYLRSQIRNNRFRSTTLYLNGRILCHWGGLSISEFCQQVENRPWEQRGLNNYT